MRAQTVRAMTESSSQNDPNVYTPDFMREQQAIPLGGTPRCAASVPEEHAPPLERSLDDFVYKPGLTRRHDRQQRGANGGETLPRSCTRP